MNDTGEKGDRPPIDEESIPTASFCPGMVGLGEQIGRYKLLRILGEGGFGVVYLAEQQRPMKRQVALKIIKPGMDSVQVIKRLEAERQALALLDHPNIAHVYDAGTTKFGRPYFVMEYVKGVPITEHCDRQKLTIEERLKLFIKVCEAIQHAHQKGIIHRDIKPSNIQVCIQGEQIVPKVIDFGVAKALSQPLTERTLVTEQGQLIGTPEYISPEQAEMTNQDIDTRSDIYSLGVLFYELLTGTLPFESRTLRKGSLEQMRQIIREAEPKTPSTRVSSLDAEASTKRAKCCQSDADSLRRRLRGDLDWITLKALEKDRIRRYQTAHALSEDIERHLNNEPVLAGPPSVLYRFQKLVQRNNGIFAGVATVAASLVIALTISAVSLVREQDARRIAVDALERKAALHQQVQAEAYASDMSLAQQALAMNDLGRARRLLEDHRPATGEVDLRGWEWRYLWNECRSDDLGELCQYPYSAHSVAFSPDGRVLAVAGTVQTFVDVWDVPGRKLIRTLQPESGHIVAFSPRGNLLATDAGEHIRLWQTGTWTLVRELHLAGWIHRLKFSPDGALLASLSSQDGICIWEVDRWTVVRQIPDVKVGWGFIGLDFSPDGKSLVIERQTNHLQVVDLASGNTKFDVSEAHPEDIISIAWSPNGSVIVSGSGFVEGSIRLWDAASGKSLGELKGHTSWISDLVFSKDGLWLYSASGDQTIRIWDIGQQRCLAILRGSRHEVLGLALSPDGTTLASACKDGVVAFWSAVPGSRQEWPRLIPMGRSARPAFAPDSRILAVPQADTVSLFDLATSKETERLPTMDADASAVTYSPDGTLLVIGSKKGKIRVWSFSERRLLKEWDDHKEEIRLLRFRADGTRMLSLDAKGKVIWWNALTWQTDQTFVIQFPVVRIGHEQLVDVSPDGCLLAVAARGALHWLNAESGELLATTTGNHMLRATGVGFSSDGLQVASTYNYGTVALWDASSFRLVTAFKGHLLGARGPSFSPDGRRLVTNGTGLDAIRLWDLLTHRELIALSGNGVFRFAAFSPDGNWLAAYNPDEGMFHLWRAPSWEEIEAEEKKMESGRFP